MPQPASSPTTTATPRRRLHRPVLLIVGIMLIAANLRAALTSVGPLLEQIQQQLALSATAAGLINSLPLILFAVLSPLTPALAKRIGIERTLGLALALLVCGIALRSLPQDAMLWPGSILIGAAIAFANVVLPTLVKRDFPHRAAAMIAAYAAVMSLVAAIASGLAVPLAALADLGWRFSLLCWGLPALLALLVWLPQLRRSATPATKEPQPTEPQRYRSPWGSALGWQVAMFMGLQSIAFYTIIGWFSAFAASHGTSRPAGRIRAVRLPGGRDRRQLCHGGDFAAGARSAGNRAGQFPADLYRRRRIIGATRQFTGVADVCRVGAGSSLVLALSFFGLRSQHHHQATLLSGMAQSVGYLLAALGPTLFGLLHDLTDGWRWPLIVLLCLTVLQMLFGALAGRSRVIS